MQVLLAISDQLGRTHSSMYPMSSLCMSECCAHGLSCNPSFARADAEVIVRGVNVSDNAVALGSTIFIVSSTLYTDRVNFQDSTSSSDLLAVQSDQNSTYVAEKTAFIGFHGEVGSIDYLFKSKLLQSLFHPR